MAVYYKDKKIQVLREPKYRCEIRNPNVIGTQEVSGAYSIRQTGAGDPDVSDILLKEHISYVKQIKGSTVRCENLIDISQMLNEVLTEKDGVYTMTKLENNRFSETYTFPTPLPAGTYTFSCEYLNYTGTNYYWLQILLGGNAALPGFRANVLGELVTVDVSAPITYIKLFCQGTDEIGTIISFKNFMMNVGDTALPYQPYFTDLKHAYINSIKSTGRNLIDYFNGRFSITYGSVEDSGSNWVEAKGVLSYVSEGYWYTSYHSNGWLECRLPTPFNITDRQGILSFDLTLLETVEGKTSFYMSVFRDSGQLRLKNYTINNTTDKQHFELTVNLTSSQIRSLVFTLNSLHVRIENVMLSCEGAETSFSPYTEDIYELPETLELAEYDTFNPQTGELTRQTGYVTNETGFTEEEIATYDSAIVSADNLSLEYKLATPTITKIENALKLYKSWNHGSESVIQGETDNSEYGAMPTITQKYFIHKE